MRTIVFDFDGTLINGDSIRQYYHYCVRRNPLKVFRLIFVYGLIILSKFNFITVKKEKELALNVFFNGSYSDFSRCLKSYIDELHGELNDIYSSDFLSLDSTDRIIIASASFRDIIEPLFPNATILATTIEIDGDRILGITDHPYGNEKHELLQRMGVDSIDHFYTDSQSDMSTSKLARKTSWVANGQVHFVTP